MIKVSIKKHNDSIISIEVKGHADSNEYGKDLVCAGVSTITVGIANTLCEKGFLDNGRIDLENGYAYVEVYNSNDVYQLILETFEIMLFTIEENNSDYIQISKMEV
jgi:uncharacterized protein YsxB (DUF464 family)